VPSIQVLFVGNLQQTPIRAISAKEVNRLVLVPGIVISSSRTRPKAVSIAIRCRNCASERTLQLASGFGSVPLPRYCTALYVVVGVATRRQAACC